LVGSTIKTASGDQNARGERTGWHKLGYVSRGMKVVPQGLEVNLRIRRLRRSFCRDS